MHGRQSDEMVSPADVVGPTEDTVLALLELLVYPFLPSRPSSRHNAAPGREELVAKQVHAVVLLYNYYHRKQRQELEFLEFDSFCKLTVIMKPDILTYMKLMQRSDYMELDDLITQLSLTEKMIMEACDISKILDASKPSPLIDGWPIGKVAVFLVDSRKENCFLLHSSITQGVWSVIEKEIYVDNYNADVTAEERLGNKKKKITKKPHRENRNADEACLQQLAFSAVKSACGITQSDLQILESHTVYSISKEKTTARFYIMQCKQLNPEANHVAIKDVMDSLQGPLVRKEHISWTATSVVEYLHILPYAGILKDWLSRDALLNASEHTQAGTEVLNDNKEALPNTKGHLESEIVVESQDISSSADMPCTSAVYQRRKKSQNNLFLSNNGSSMKAEISCLDDNEAAVSGPSDIMKIDESICPNATLPDDGKSTFSPYEKHVDDQNMSTMHVDGDPPASTYGVIVREESTPKLPFCEYNSGNASSENISSKQNEVEDHALVAFQSSSQPDTITSKDNLLSQAALKSLLKKKEKLSHQLRNIEDEIALCDKNILTILDGSKDELAVKIDSIIEGCNNIHLRIAAPAYEKMCQQDFSQYTKQKKLFEATLDVQNPCQELDAICYENNWILPTYSISASHGGFTANATVKGEDFECSCGGSLCATPQRARESAASLVLAKLRSLASK